MLSSGLDRGKSCVTFWRALRLGLQSLAAQNSANFLFVRPASVTQAMLFTQVQMSDMPKLWEVSVDGDYIRLSFVRPERVFHHHLRLNKSFQSDGTGRVVLILTEIDYGSLRPLWGMDWYFFVAMPQPIFPGSVYLISTELEVMPALQKLLSSCDEDRQVGI